MLRVNSAGARPVAGAPPGEKSWCVYLLRCADGTLYAGITNDVKRRLAAHQAGQVKYTRGRRPVAVAWTEPADGRSAALRREAALKRLRRKDKLALVEGARKAPLTRA